MWHFRSKCWRIKALVKANYKWLKAVLAYRVRNFNLASILPKLGKLPLFDNFFLDLADFQDLDNFSLFKFPNLDKFWLFNFLNFLAIFLSRPISNLLTSLPPTFSHSKNNFSSNIVIFSIKVSGAVILLNA